MWHETWEPSLILVSTQEWKEDVQGHTQLGLWTPSLKRKTKTKAVPIQVSQCVRPTAKPDNLNSTEPTSVLRQHTHTTANKCNKNFRGLYLGAGEMAQWLNMCGACRGSESASHTHTRWFTVACDSSPRGSNISDLLGHL